MWDLAEKEVNEQVPTPKMLNLPCLSNVRNEQRAIIRICFQFRPSVGTVIVASSGFIK